MALTRATDGIVGLLGAFVVIQRYLTQSREFPCPIALLNRLILSKSLSIMCARFPKYATVEKKVTVCAIVCCSLEFPCPDSSAVDDR